MIKIVVSFDNSLKLFQKKFFDIIRMKIIIDNIRISQTNQFTVKLGTFWKVRFFSKIQKKKQKPLSLFQFWSKIWKCAFWSFWYAQTHIFRLDITIFKSNLKNKITIYILHDIGYSQINHILDLLPFVKTDPRQVYQCFAMEIIALTIQMHRTSSKLVTPNILQWKETFSPKLVFFLLKI